MTARQVTGLTAVLAILLVPALASAQGITIGIKGGLNNGNITLDFPAGETIVPSPKSMNGVTFGGWVGRDFNAKAGMLVEFLWAQGGTEIDFTEEDGTRINQEVSVDYFQVPVLGRANFKMSDTAVMHVFGGPTFAFKTGQSEKLTVDGIDIPVEDDDEASLKGNDVGITIGAGFDIKRFVIDVRYTWGLMNINDGTGDDEPEVKTRQFAVMFGIELWRK